MAGAGFAAIGAGAGSGFFVAGACFAGVSSIPMAAAARLAAWANDAVIASMIC
jgi:hypothetical protein